MSDFTQTDVLFLLVGTNPLPNYVAAQLLAKDGGTVHLLHTEGRKGTGEVADRLKRQIKAAKPSVTIILHGIDDADGEKIEKKMIEIIPESGKTVGLNYTGGTKPMAVHVYHVLKQKFPNDCYFSYLDARSLKMFINKGNEPTQAPNIGKTVELTLQGIVALHGYELPEPRRTPEHPEFYHLLANIHATHEGFHEWKGNWNDRRKSKGWLRTDRPLTTLPTKKEYPNLAPIIDTFDRLGGDPVQVAQFLGQTSLDSCYMWFSGTWLEEYVLDALTTIVGGLGIQSFGIGLKPKPVAQREKSNPRNFELDLAAMMGYQLFAISCIASDHADGETKKHLFEVFVRARQLGGDEARVGLVCCVEQPDILRNELEKSWDAEGKIRVFGQHDLPDLAACLKDWFETANKERP